MAKNNESCCIFTSKFSQPFLIFLKDFYKIKNDLKGVNFIELVIIFKNVFFQECTQLIKSESKS